MRKNLVAYRLSDWHVGIIRDRAEELQKNDTEALRDILDDWWKAHQIVELETKILEP